MSAVADPRTASARVEDGRRKGPGGGGGLAGLAWLTWRQHRLAIAGIVLTTVAMAAFGAYLSAAMTSIFHQCGNTVCATGSTQFATLNGSSFGLNQLAGYVLNFTHFMPVLVGMFLGTPLLAREHEQRTLLLAWSQDVSPARWLWTKVLLLGAVVAGATALLAGEADHLAHVENSVSGGSMFEATDFAVSGMLPLVLAVVWFVVGVALGALARRTLVAAAAALFGFIGLVLLVQWRYPTFTKPLTLLQSFKAPGTDAYRDSIFGPNALVISHGGVGIGPGFVSGLYTASGTPVSYSQMNQMCPNFLFSGPGELYSCSVTNRLTTMATYQPASRIPEFHLIVVSGYAAIGVVALLLVWLAVRRTSLSAG